MGLGFVRLRKNNYEFVYHCTCRHGEKYNVKWTDKEGKEHTGASSVDTLPAGTIEEIKNGNIKRYSLKKAGNRYLKEFEPKLTDDERKQYRELAKEISHIGAWPKK